MSVGQKIGSTQHLYPQHEHKNTVEMYPISQPYSNPQSQSLSTVRQRVVESITTTVTHLYRHINL